MFCYKMHKFYGFIEKKAGNVQIRSSFPLCEIGFQISYSFIVLYTRKSFSFIPENYAEIPLYKNNWCIIFLKRAKFISLQRENKSTKPKIEPKIILW